MWMRMFFTVFFLLMTVHTYAVRCLWVCKEMREGGPARFLVIFPLILSKNKVVAGYFDYVFEKCDSHNFRHNSDTILFKPAFKPRVLNSISLAEKTEIKGFGSILCGKDKSGDESFLKVLAVSPLNCFFAQCPGEQPLIKTSPDLVEILLLTPVDSHATRFGMALKQCFKEVFEQLLNFEFYCDNSALNRCRVLHGSSVLCSIGSLQPHIPESFSWSNSPVIRKVRSSAVPIPAFFKSSCVMTTDCTSSARGPVCCVCGESILEMRPDREILVCRECLNDKTDCVRVCCLTNAARSNLVRCNVHFDTTLIVGNPPRYLGVPVDVPVKAADLGASSDGNRQGCSDFVLSKKSRAHDELIREREDLSNLLASLMDIINFHLNVPPNERSGDFLDELESLTDQLRALIVRSRELGEIRLQEAYDLAERCDREIALLTAHIERNGDD